MRKVLFADKDAYITNKIVKSTPAVSSNTGIAGSLDLFKVYTLNASGTSPTRDVSRALVHFDLSSLKKDVEDGEVDINDSSFWCTMKFRDVYGGQPNPVNFTVDVYPLSSSFEEGFGKDVSYYADNDVANWISSSFGNSWFVTGCGLDTTADTPGDYITGSSLIPSTRIQQFFKNGTEDLVVDVTSIVSATLAGDIPDEGYRLSFTPEIESDDRTYFVKRFGSRHAYNESKRPIIEYGFDDSITDDTLNLHLDANCRINLYNYTSGELQNIFSGSSEVSGSNCLLLCLTTDRVDGSGSYSLYFTGSQQTRGSNLLEGSYYSNLSVSSSDEVIAEKLGVSSSISFSQAWLSLDNSLTYSLGNTLYVKRASRGSKFKGINKYTVSVTNVRNSYSREEKVTLRVNVQDYSDPLIKTVRLPVELPGIVLKKAFYRIRDTVTGEVAIPFDEAKNSTRISSDDSGMFFEFYTSPLISGRSYVIDVMLSSPHGEKVIFSDASSPFRIEV